MGIQGKDNERTLPMRPRGENSQRREMVSGGPARPRKYSFISLAISVMKEGALETCEGPIPPSALGELN